VIKFDVDRYLRVQGRYPFLVTAVSSISFYDVLINKDFISKEKLNYVMSVISEKFKAEIHAKLFNNP
jgi:hypothetical protein